MNPDTDAKELLAGVLEDNSDISCPLGYSFITGTHDGSLLIICPEHGSKSISGADLIVKTISDDMYSRVYSLSLIHIFTTINKRSGENIAR